jgi:hypothetical protein
MQFFKMRNLIRKAYKRILPDFLLVKIDAYINMRGHAAAYRAVLDYTKVRQQGSETGETEKIHNFLKVNGLHCFPYPFVLEYLQHEVTVKWDEQYKLPYVLHEGHKLYFPENMERYDIRRLYRSLLAEQDPRSPHHYNFRTINPQSRILDLGGAEGIFTLRHIDHIAAAVIVEGDKRWIKALEATFAPYKDKVTIVPRFINNTDCTLAGLHKEYGPFTQIKMDIEGWECTVLEGLGQLPDAALKNIEIVACTYHNQDDARICEEALRKNGFKTRFSDGYAFFFYDPNIDQPFLRKTLIQTEV